MTIKINNIMKNQTKAKAFATTIFFEIDQQDGKNGDAEACDLACRGHFLEKHHRYDDGHQQAQLHKDGGQHNAVLFCVGLQQTKAGREQKSVDQAQT